MRNLPIFLAMLSLCSVAASAATQTLTIDADYLNLDTGVLDTNQPFPPANGWDIFISSDPVTFGVNHLYQNENNGVAVGFISGGDYNLLGFNDIPNVPLSGIRLEVDLLVDSVWFIMSEEGRFYKLGNALFDSETWTYQIDYEELVPPPPPVRDEYLSIESDYMDLDQNTVTRDQWGSPPIDPWDFYFTYDPELPETYYLTQNQTYGNSIAHMPGRSYATVTYEDVATASFTSELVTQPFGDDRTLLVMTEQGRYYKVGNAAYDWYAWRFYFDYEELIPTPPTGYDEHLAIESDYLDLDTGTVDRDEWSGPPATTWDVYVTYAPAVPDTFYLYQNQTIFTNVAHLAGFAYEAVTFADAFTAPYVSTHVDEPFAVDGTIVVMTSEGRYYKLGNPELDSYNWHMYFDYEELTPPPPPSRVEYLAVDSDYLDLDTGLVDRDYWGSPPTTPWDVRITYDIYNPDSYIVEQNQLNWVNIAHLVGETYETVDFNQAFMAAYTTDVVMEPFGTDRTIVVMTPDARFYKLGNPYFDLFNWRMHFDYEELIPPPPPSRVEYLAVDSDYLDLDTGLVDRDIWTGPPVSPWDVRITYDIYNPDSYIVEQNQANWVNIAHLVGETYETVDFNQAFMAAYTTDVVMEPFGTDRTIVVMTPDARFYKLGNPYFDSFAWRMHFDYEELIPPPPPSRVEYLAVDSDYLDLDTGLVDRDYWGGPPVSPWDVRITYDIYNPDSYIVEQNQANWVNIAHLVGETYETVDFNQAFMAAYTTDVVMEPFGTDRTIVVMTPDARFYKLGNPYFDSFAWRMHFDYEELIPPPPPSRVEYLAVDSDYLDLDTGLVDRDYWGGPPTSPWDVRITYDTLNPDNYIVEQNQTTWVNIAHLVGETYETVDFNQAFMAAYTTDVVMEPFGTDRTIVVMTPDARFYKLGNPYFDLFNWRMHFDYEELIPPPPPSRVEYLGVEYDYLNLDSGLVERDQWGSAPATTWDVHVVYDSLLDNYYLYQNQTYGAQVAHLVGATYESVTYTDSLSATFGTPTVDQHFGTDRVLLIITDTGRVFKLGNPYYDLFDWRTYFDYEELLP